MVLFCAFAWSSAQEVHYQLRDSLTNESVPFATVLTNFGESTISNEEGHFRLTKNTALHPTDSLFISCMGFRDLSISTEETKDSLLYLSPKEIELNAVILSQQNLSAEEIVKRTREQVAKKYDLSLTNKP